MAIVPNIHCARCGSVNLVPVLYGIKQPWRDFDLSLQGAIVLLAGFRYNLGVPLWACSQCLALVDQEGTRVGDNEVVSGAHFDALSAAFKEYVALDNDSRSYYMGRIKLRELISKLSPEHETEFLLEQDQNGAKGRVVTTALRTLLELDEATLKDILRYCRDDGVLLQDGSKWAISSAKMDSGVQIKISRLALNSE